MKPPASLRSLRRAARVFVSPVAREDARHEWRRRLGSEPPLPAGAGKIVVVCHGNICRSPFAAAILARDEDLQVRSAGLAAGEGTRADPMARETAQRFGVDLSEHRAHRLEKGDVEWADLLLVMQGHQWANVARSFPGAAVRTRLLGDYLPAAPFQLEDPWGRDAATFERVFARVEQAAEAVRGRLRDARA